MQIDRKGKLLIGSSLHDREVRQERTKAGLPARKAKVQANPDATPISCTIIVGSQKCYRLWVKILIVDEDS